MQNYKYRHVRQIPIALKKITITMTSKKKKRKQLENSQTLGKTLTSKIKIELTNFSDFG